MENVVDWAKWLESVEDAEIRKKSTPAVEKIEKRNRRIVGRKTCCGKRQIRLLENSQDNSSFAGMILFPPKSFFRKARGEIKLLLRQNPQTKVQCILNVEMIQNRIGEDDVTSDPFFRSGQKENLGNNFEIAEEMIQEMIEAMENYNKRGSNWIFKKAIRLEVNFVRWKPLGGKPLGGKPLGGSGWIPMPEKLAQKKAIINIKNTDNFCFKLCMARAKNPVKSHPEVVTEKTAKAS